jgi:hypothetical protein
MNSVTLPAMPPMFGKMMGKELFIKNTSNT